MRAISPLPLSPFRRLSLAQSLCHHLLLPSLFLSLVHPSLGRGGAGGGRRFTPTPTPQPSGSPATTVQTRGSSSSSSSSSSVAMEGSIDSLGDKGGTEGVGGGPPVSLPGRSQHYLRDRRSSSGSFSAEANLLPQDARLAFSPSRSTPAVSERKTERGREEGESGGDDNTSSSSSSHDDDDSSSSSSSSTSSSSMTTEGDRDEMTWCSLQTDKHVNEGGEGDHQKDGGGEDQKRSLRSQRNVRTHESEHGREKRGSFDEEEDDETKGRGKFVFLRGGRERETKEEEGREQEQEETNENKRKKRTPAARHIETNPPDRHDQHIDAPPPSASPLASSSSSSVQDHHLCRRSQRFAGRVSLFQLLYQAMVLVDTNRYMYIYPDTSLHVYTERAHIYIYVGVHTPTHAIYIYIYCLFRCSFLFLSFSFSIVDHFNVISIIIFSFSTASP